MIQYKYTKLYKNNVRDLTHDINMLSNSIAIYLMKTRFHIYIIEQTGKKELKLMDYQIIEGRCCHETEFT